MPIPASDCGGRHAAGARRMATPTTSTTSMAQWPWAGQCVMPSSPPPPSPFCLLRAGINRYLGVGDKSIWLGMGRGLDAIRDEFAASGTEDDLVCLEYVLEGTAGCLPRKWQHSGGKQMDAFYEGREEDGRRGRPLSHFVEHPQARQAALLPEHVVALRLYTTAAFKSINDPLRNRSGAHPFPVTVAFINDGIKRLRAVGAGAADASERRDFWRGLRNVALPDSFHQTGGTEYAPLSTSSDLEVALHYSDAAQERLLFKLTTASFLERGASLQFLSAFPGEVEYLYPPLTFLDPTGKVETITTSCDVNYTVIEVQPRVGS
mmetsp:Transcript_45154/g.146730  ORF Transcript_45154/g.146730 Transcript_45154/m.146730 type:complete len:320 (-) Transcript_45154:236-1195(-)